LSLEAFWFLTALNLIIFFAKNPNASEGLSGFQNVLILITTLLIFFLLIFIPIHRFFLWKLMLYPIWGDPNREIFRQEYYESFGQILDRRDFGTERENRLMDMEDDENFRE